MINVVDDLSGKLVHSKELQIYSAAMPVVVTDVGNPRANDRLNAQLFIQFACQSLLGAFAGLDLAARKLPLRSHRLIWTALSD